jgi:intein-encoded DNA endonuclease-like protein
MDVSTTQPSTLKNRYFAGSNFTSSRYFPFLENRDNINEVAEAFSEMLFPSTLDK